MLGGAHGDGRKSRRLRVRIQVLCSGARGSGLQGAALEHAVHRYAGPVENGASETETGPIVSGVPFEEVCDEE